MKTIHVAKAFDLLLSPSNKVHVPAGVQNVEDAVADHWFTKAHLSNGGFGSEEYALAARAAADAAFVKAMAARNEYQGLEEAVADAERAAGLEVSEPAFKRLWRDEDGGDEDGGKGHDTLSGSDSITAADAAATTLDAGQGNDVLTGNDILGDDSGTDTLKSGQGNDTIEGGKGHDSVTAPAETHRELTSAQVKALDRIDDGVDKAGGSPPGGNKPKPKGL